MPSASNKKGGLADVTKTSRAKNALTSNTRKPSGQRHRSHSYSYYDDDAAAPPKKESKAPPKTSSRQEANGDSAKRTSTPQKKAIVTPASKAKVKAAQSNGSGAVCSRKQVTDLRNRRPAVGRDIRDLRPNRNGRDVPDVRDTRDADLDETPRTRRPSLDRMRSQPSRARVQRSRSPRAESPGGLARREVGSLLRAASGGDRTPTPPPRGGMRMGGGRTADSHSRSRSRSSPRGMRNWQDGAWDADLDDHFGDRSSGKYGGQGWREPRYDYWGPDVRDTWRYDGKGKGKSYGSKGDRGKGGGKGSSGSVSRVHVSNLPTNVTENYLAEMFEIYGPVLGLQILYSRKGGGEGVSAIIRFGKREAAGAAIEDLNGRKLRASPRPLIAQMARPNPLWG